MRLRVEVATAPDAGLVRPAIEARLRGAPWPAGPEAVVAQAVADAVAAQVAREGR
jgi:hypothetical protein